MSPDTADAYPASVDSASPFVADLVAKLSARGLTIAVAESLTGGLLTAELVRPAGASAVLLGGIVAYDTSLKHSLLGVDAALLEQHGPVHPLVAQGMAANVRERLAVNGRPADVGLSTTGVAGPDPQESLPAGTVFVGLAIGDRVDSIELHLEGTRDQVRAKVVTEALNALANRLDSGGI